MHDHPRCPRSRPHLERRQFLAAGLAAGLTPLVVGNGPAARGGQLVTDTAAAPGVLPRRMFGKTRRELPILAYGGAGLPREWLNPLSTDDRVALVRHAYDQGIRYFDTAGNYMESQAILGEALKHIRKDVYLVTKVETTDPTKVRAAVETSLGELQTDYLDAILIHGTPGLEQMSVARAFQIHAELVKLRDEGVTRFLGLSAHSYFDKALDLIRSGGFDQCMLSYGYIPRGYNQIHSARMVALRDACLAKAHELDMGIAAMKVMGAGVLGAWAPDVVKEFDRNRLARLPGAAIRHVLADDRVDLLVIGMRLPHEIDANIQTICEQSTYSADDRQLLADFAIAAYQSDTIKAMAIE